MISLRALIIIFLGMLPASFGHAFGPFLAEAPYGSSPGYTDNVDDEYESESEEMVLMEKPEVLNVPNFHDRLFTSQLSDEFRQRYQDQFGRTEQEENYFLTSKQGYYQSPTGLTTTQVDDQRRRFAEYMIKRLAEFHTDNLMKNDPVFKKVYAVKQAVSNYNLSIGPSSRFDMTYSFIGNYGLITFTNPLLVASASVRMDPSALLPTAPVEIYLSGVRALSKSVGLEVGYYFYDKAYRALVSRRITPLISANVSETLHVVSLYQPDRNREGLTIAGLSIIF